MACAWVQSQLLKNPTLACSQHVALQQTEHRSSVVHGKCVDDDWLVLQPQHGDIILMKVCQHQQNPCSWCICMESLQPMH